MFKAGCVTSQDARAELYVYARRRSSLPREAFEEAERVRELELEWGLVLVRAGVLKRECGDEMGDGDDEVRTGKATLVWKSIGQRKEAKESRQRATAANRQ